MEPEFPDLWRTKNLEKLTENVAIFALIPAQSQRNPLKHIGLEVTFLQIFARSLQTSGKTWNEKFHNLTEIARINLVWKSVKDLDQISPNFYERQEEISTKAGLLSRPFFLCKLILFSLASCVHTAF